MLKSFAAVEQTPCVPGLDLPGPDYVSIAKGYGCDAVRVDDMGAIKQAVAAAWTKNVPTLLEIRISPRSRGWSENSNHMLARIRAGLSACVRRPRRARSL
ncbi:MAG: thiamine pyrophosphate-dependent enzyme [Solirubrobacteraceae bacterium]